MSSVSTVVSQLLSGPYGVEVTRVVYVVFIKTLVSHFILKNSFYLKRLDILKIN